MDPHLRKLQDQLSAAISGLTPDQLARTRPGKWSIAEIMEHLFLTYTGTSKGFSRLLEAGKPLATAPTMKHRVGSILVVGFGYMPSGRESPPQARPRGTASDKVAAEIFPALVEMDAIINRCEEKYGATRKVLDHPFLGPFSLAQWRKFHLVHGRHHIKQIQALRRM